VIEAYGGSCHCGRVRFRVRFSAAQGSFKCNCSICQKTRAWLAPVGSDALMLLSGEADLAEYQFAARKIRHRFCRHCGVKVFGQGLDAAGQPFFAVSVAALDDIPAARLATLPISYFNGRHDDYSRAPSDTSLL
jgi:hypothetical protein